MAEGSIVTSVDSHGGAPLSEKPHNGNQENEEDEDPLDPRVESALGALNEAIDSVNSTEAAVLVSVAIALTHSRQLERKSKQKWITISETILLF